jgi:hypothetical protein
LPVQRVEVTVRLVADHPLEISGGEVELVRDAAVTRSRRQWSGVGGPVSVRSSATVARADLGLSEPLAAGQQLLGHRIVDVPRGEATIAGQPVQQDYSLRARIHADDGCGGEGATPVTMTFADCPAMSGRRPAHGGPSACASSSVVWRTSTR